MWRLLCSLLYTPHKSWYSWTIQTTVNGVYAFGFLFMLPQLFLNYKLKSVAHLPWRAFMYKAFNTFIGETNSDVSWAHGSSSSCFLLRWSLRIHHHDADCPQSGVLQRRRGVPDLSLSAIPLPSGPQQSGHQVSFRSRNQNNLMKFFLSDSGVWFDETSLFRPENVFG